MRPIFLIKFGSEKNMKDLIQNGTVFCRSIEGFRERAKEKKPGGDIFEGVTEIKNYDEKDNLILTFASNEKPDREIKVKLTKGQFRANVSNIGNVYSLYSINEPLKAEQEIHLDDRMLDFGTHAVLIKDIGQFLKRVKQKARSLGYPINWGLIDYFDSSKKLIEDLSFFHKSVEFQYENEFRLFIANIAGEDLKLTIGNMEDIAQIFESKQLQQLKVVRN